MAETLIIGIAGGTGSGKTTITNKIIEHFKGDVSVVCHDNYYKVLDDIPFEERKKLNYDHPDSFDTDLMIEDLKKLREHVPVYSPVYDYTVHNRSKEDKILVMPNKVIIVEGILLFCDKRLRDMFDIKIYVDTDADVRILRRLVRDMNERGRTVESIITQYLSTVKPMHELFVEPSRRYADVIVPEGFNPVALDMIFSKIESFLA